MKDNERKRLAREIADHVAHMLGQEYKKHDGGWWLWTLGKPVRPLTEQEIQEAKQRGNIK